MAVVAVSFVTVDRCFVIREGHSRPAMIRVGLGVQPMQRIKLYVLPRTRICTILVPASLTRVGLLYFYLPLVESSCRWVAEVRGEGVLVPTE